MQESVRLNSVKAMANRRDVVTAKTRLTLGRLQSALELAQRAIIFEASAKGRLQSGGTVRMLVRALLKELDRAAAELISTHAKAGSRNPADVGSAVRSALGPPAKAYLAECRKPLKSIADVFDACQPDIDEFFDSLTDMATVELAEYPTLSTDVVITELCPEKFPEGWKRVQRVLQKAQARLATAKDEEDFQSVGHFCREALISTAQAVYDPDRHPPLDGVAPSNTDAKRRLDAFFATELSGSANEAMRTHARSAVKLADALTHKQTATLLVGRVCFESTSSVVNLAAIVTVNK